MGIGRLGAGRFVPIIAAVLAMAVSGCAIIVVDEKGNEREVLGLDEIRPGERIKAFDQTGLFGFRPPALNRYGPGTTRYIVGAELGISNFHAETDHFFAPANVSGGSAGPTATIFGGYHRAFSHDPINQTTTWGRLEGSFTLGDMSVRTAPNFGNEFLHSRLSYLADLSIGGSIQLHKNQNRPTDICLFFLGGPSFAKVNYDFANFSGSQNKWGWHVGGGLEIEFAKNWVIRSEIRYTDLGKFGIGNGIGVEHRDTSFRLGFGYRQILTPPPPPPS
jgi:opacity protein-like surface antigen